MEHDDNFNEHSRNFVEHDGSFLEHERNFYYFKIYTNPALETLDSANLGVIFGPLNSGVPLNLGVSCCADDYYLMTDSQSKLQNLLNIAENVGDMYRVKYGTSKTKITISGPAADQNYYAGVCPWTMDGQKVSVTENNEHLGQIVSGTTD